MKLPRRRFLHLRRRRSCRPNCFSSCDSGKSTVTACVGAGEQPLAERLAAYAHDLRYEDLDAATIERVKTHVIDTIGCGMCAWDERPVRICREIAFSVAWSGDDHRNTSASNN